MSDAPIEEPSKPKLPNVALAGGIMMASLLLSRILGLVRESVIAWKFGANHYTDAYLLAFSVPDTLFFLIAGGALSSAFIPVFSEYLHTQREREAWHIFSAVTTIMSVLVTAFIVLAWIFAEPMLHVLAAGKVQKVPEFVPLIVYMSRIVLPAQFAFFIGGLMFGTLYARQVFAIPGLGPNIYNIGIILGALVLSAVLIPAGFEYLPGNHENLGVVGMSWGALIGAAVGNLVIPWFAMKRIGLQFKPTFDTKHPGVRKVFRLMLPVIFGLSLPGVYALIMQAFGSFYEAGVVTYLDKSNKLMQVPLGVFGQSLAIGVFPALAQFFAQERMDLFRSQLSSTVRTVIYLTVPVTILMVVLAPQIVSALLEQGKFTQRDVELTAQALRIACIGICAWCLQPVLMRAFFAVQMTARPIILGTVTTVAFFLLILVLRQTPLGYLSLPMAGSISAIFLAIALLVAVSGQTGGIDFKGISVTLGKSLLASAGVALVSSLFLLEPIAASMRGNKLMTLILLGLAFLLSAWAYYFATKLLGMPESATISRAMAKVNAKLGRGSTAG